MWKYGKDKLKKAEARLDKLSKEDIKKGATEISGAVVENGVEVVKTGIFGIVNGVLIKIALVVTFIVVITAGGCVGTSVAVDALTSDKVEVQANPEKY